MLAAIPRPYIPDPFSITAAKDDEFACESVPGLCNDPSGDPHEWESTSAIEELAKDLQYIGKYYQKFYDNCADAFEKTLDLPWPRTGSVRHRRHQLQESITNTTETFRVPSPPVTSRSSSSSLSRATSASTPTTSGEAPDYNDANVPALNDRIARYQSKSVHRRQHRVTALTTYAADSIATNLAGYIEAIMLLPLEALFVRSLAYSFLSSPQANPTAQAAADRWRTEIYPFGSWFGMGLRGGWRGMGDYVGKMVLVTGMEMGVNLMLWQVCTGLSWRMGHRWYGWGNL